MSKEHFKKIFPDPVLRTYIQYYTFVDVPFVQSKQIEFQVLPSSYTRMIIWFGEPSLLKDANNNIERIDSCGVAGFISKPVSFIPTQSVRQVMIHFTPWGIQPFLNFPLSEITNSRAPLNEIFRNEMDALYKGLEQAGNSFKRKQVLDAFFKKKLRKISGLDKRDLAVVEYIFKNRGILKLADLSKELFLGERTMQRIVHNSVGINYKFFSTLVRIEQVRFLLNAGNHDLKQVALRSGYYDQAHFINEFKSVFGSSPRSYVEKLQNSVWNRIENLEHELS